jgi:hypothetical protein
MLGPVPSIRNALILLDGSDPRHRAEDDDGAGANPSPTPPHKGEGLALPLPQSPRSLAGSGPAVGRDGKLGLSPSPCGRGGGGSSPKKTPTRKYFHPPPSHAPYPHLVPSSATPRGVAARWGRRWGKGDDVNPLSPGLRETATPERPRVRLCMHSLGILAHKGV